jgi:zinc protease
MQLEGRGLVRALVPLLFIALTFGLPVLAAPAADDFHVPIEYYKLPNGLRVVLSPDHTAPTVCVGVYYRIGFRVEPRDRTGFAHLFEHMMFQGSKNLGKMEFIKLIQSNGGILNGSTRFDFTTISRLCPPTNWKPSCGRKPTG